MLRNREEKEENLLKGVNLIANPNKLELGYFTSLANWIPSKKYKIKKKRGPERLSSDPQTVDPITLGFGTLVDCGTTTPPGTVGACIDCLTIDPADGTLIAKSASAPNRFDIIGVATGAGGTFTISGDQRTIFGAGDTITVFNSTGNDNDYVIDSVALVGTDTAITITTSVPNATIDGSLAPSYPIVAVAVAPTNTFRVAGDQTTVFDIGDTIWVFNSTGNDGGYTLSNVTFSSPNTILTTNEDIIDATADGSIILSAPCFCFYAPQICWVVDE